jgi:DNA transformation protein
VSNFPNTHQWVVVRRGVVHAKVVSVVPACSRPLPFADGKVWLQMSEAEDTIDGATRHVIDLLAPIGPVVARSLLGTWGLYLEDQIFGLVHGGVVYFRTSDTTISRYVDAGCRPYRYVRADGSSTVMPYHEVPQHVLDDSDLACAWAFESAAKAP